MKITLDVPDVDPSSGLHLAWDDDAEIHVAVRDDEVVISGNPSGLRTLARHLLTLVQPGAAPGAHLHLDEETGLKEGSAALVLSRAPGPATRFWIVGIRPVRAVPTPGGGLEVEAFDWATGRFLPAPEYISRVFCGGPEVEEIDESAFHATVERLRRERGLPSET